jgi:hypothetical protein
VFDRWGREGFEAAIELYEAVLADTTSKACGRTADELELLRDYVRLRLLVSYVGGGQASQAEPLRGQIGDARLKGAADTFLDGLRRRAASCFRAGLSHSTWRGIRQTGAG